MIFYFVKKHYLSPETSDVGGFDNIDLAKDVIKSLTENFRGLHIDDKDPENILYTHELLGIVYSITAMEMNKRYL